MITENKSIQNKNNNIQQVDVVHILKNGQQYVDKNVVLGNQEPSKGGRGSNQYARKMPNTPYYNQTIPNQPKIRQKKQSKAMYKLKAIVVYGLMGIYAMVLGITTATREILKTFATGVFLIANNQAPDTIKDGVNLTLYGLGSFMLVLPLGILFGIAMSYSRLSKEMQPMKRQYYRK